MTTHAPTHPRALTHDQLAGLKRRLESRAERLEVASDASRQQILGEDAQLFQDLTGTGDGSVAEDELERDLATAEYARAALARVRAALGRIDSGSYGDCESCGKPIGFERLKAEPSALRCVACQREREAGTGTRS